MRVVRFLSVFALTSSVAWQANAQAVPRQPDSVPTDLALALASSGGLGMTGDPQILVGELPAQFAGAVTVPRSARIVGAAYVANTTIAVIGFPTTADSAMAHFSRAVRDQGWKEPQMMAYMSGGGFRPAPSDRSTQFGMRPMLCRDGAYLSYWIGREQTMTTTIIARLQSAGGAVSGPCAADTRVRVVGPAGSLPTGAYRSPFPTLYNPPGSGGTDAYQNSRCAQPNMGTQTELRSAMTSDQILEHYARQLQDSGWTNPAPNAPIVGRVWTRKDSLGTPRVLALTVITSPLDPRCRTVKMDADRPRPDY